jgi:CMP-N,N'-diacetyllegionaminic acid synthase
MKILAIIPARGGSKRLPGKNMKLLGDKPLVTWTIESAVGIPEICEILVSTDNAEIASIAKDAGAKVPWLRPEHLASDEATSVEVAIHALNWYEKEFSKVDGVLLLQPTSPYRTRLTIQNGINLFRVFNQSPIMGVSPSQTHPQWALKQQGEFLVPFMKNHKLGTRSQELSPSFHPNGLLYLASPDYLRKENSFGEIMAIPCYTYSIKEAIDIDTDWDFKFAAYMLNQDY